MSIQLDPENNETVALFECAHSFAGKTVLEVGCGDGRLTWRYAGQAAFVLGIDPSVEKIARGQQNMPADLRDHVLLRAWDLQQLKAEQNAGPFPAQFDLAILSWSL